MDLSVLEGADPAGYRAERKLRETKKRLENPFAKTNTRAKNPGNAFVTDVVQRNSYRRNRQRDLDRLNFDVRKKRREQARDRFQNRREALNQRLEDKTAKRRAKRQAKRAKSALSKQTESTPSEEGEEGKSDNGDEIVLSAPDNDEPLAASPSLE